MRRLVVGIGQCGLDILDNLERELHIDTVAVDHDKYALHASKADDAVLVMEKEGMADSAGLRIDHELSLDSMHHIEEMVAPYDVVYIIAALGGRAGGVILPAVAKTALKKGKEVKGKIILPFEEEESKRKIAEMYLDSVRDVFTDLDVYDNNEYINQAGDTVTLDSIHSLNSIFEEINRDIVREIQSDMVYEQQ